MHTDFLSSRENSTIHIFYKNSLAHSSVGRSVGGVLRLSLSIGCFIFTLSGSSPHSHTHSCLHRPLVSLLINCCCFFFFTYFSFHRSLCVLLLPNNVLLLIWVCVCSSRCRHRRLPIFLLIQYFSWFFFFLNFLLNIFPFVGSFTILLILDERAWFFHEEICAHEENKIINYIEFFPLQILKIK